MHLRAEQPCVRMDPTQDQPRTEGIGQGAVLMLEYQDIIELIDGYCETCECNGNCIMSSCRKKTEYAERMWMEYYSQFKPLGGSE